MIGEDPPELPENDHMTAPASASAGSTSANPKPPTLVADRPHSAVGVPRPAGHGQRLTAAFEALERFPAPAESRNRVLALVSEDRPAPGDVVAAIESDVALVISVLRLANRLDHDRRGRVENVVEAVEILS